MEPVYKETLYRDMRHWIKTKFDLEDFKQLVSRGASRYGGERIILIKNNTWIYPLYKIKRFDPVTPDDYPPEGVTAWVTATHWWFNHARDEWGFNFPDVVFHMDVNDEGYCLSPDRCPAPSLALWKTEDMSDILVPYMVGLITHDILLLRKKKKMMHSSEDVSMSTL